MSNFIEIFEEKEIKGYFETPQRFIKTRETRGGKTAKYAPISYVIGALNELTKFNWSARIIKDNLEQVLSGQINEAIVLLELSIPTANGSEVVKTAYGNSEIKRFSKDGKNYKKGDFISIGDDFKAAESVALRKAASMFGLCLDLYAGDEFDVQYFSESEDDKSAKNETAEKKEPVNVTPEKTEEKEAERFKQPVKNEDKDKKITSKEIKELNKLFDKAKLDQEQIDYSLRTNYHVETLQELYFSQYLQIKDKLAALTA